MARKIEVILTQDIRKVGHKNEVISVSAGYARNYLIPQKLAVLATPQALASLEKRAEQKQEEKAKEAVLLKPILEKLHQGGLEFVVMANDKGQLFGSITPEKVKKELENKYQLDLSDKNIKYTLEIQSESEHITNVGEYKALIVFTNLGEEISTDFKITAKALHR